MSVLAASLMFLSQTETYGTMNYRLMSQARYGAESGIQKAANYLLNDYASVKPGTAGVDPLPLTTNYNIYTSPVTYPNTTNGPAVVLSSISSASNYPIASVKTAFAAAAQGTLAVGTASVQYAATATLMSMRLTESSEVVQTWDIVATGTVSGAHPATEEVRATLETQIVPNHGYSSFATASTCGAIELKGGASSDSYDSTTYQDPMGTHPPPSVSNSNGDMGTNGNLKETGNTTILNGKLYTPRSGVGTCSSGNVNALTQSGGATVTDGLVQLPQAWLPPAPAIIAPNPLPPTTNLNITDQWTCSDLASYLPNGATCSGSAGNLKVSPNGAIISWGNVSVGNQTTLTLYSGTYNLNSLSVSQNTTYLNIGDPTGTNSGTIHMTFAGKDVSNTLKVGSGGSIVVPTQKDNGYTLVMDIMESNQSNNTPIAIDGNAGITNWSYDPQRFQLNYAGTRASSVTGGGAAAFLLNAPNADVTLNGGSDFYGSLIVKTLKDTGGTHLHYDRNLATNFGIAGSPLLTSFSWKRF